MNLLEQIKENAKKCNKRIVLPEGTEERTLKAADIDVYKRQIQHFVTTT